MYHTGSLLFHNTQHLDKKGPSDKHWKK